MTGPLATTGDWIATDARRPDGTRGEIAIRDGRFAAIGADRGQTGACVRVSLNGALVLPALVDGHLHLDKTLMGDGWVPHQPCAGAFDLRERVAIEKKILAAAAPVEQRAAALVERAVARGTGHIRTHVDIDPDTGLDNLHAVLQVRERYRDAVTIKIVAFPQSGILAASGTDTLLDAALRSGADGIGGLDPIGVDNDLHGHLDVVFGLAEKHGAPVDIHLHDGGGAGLTQIREIARRTHAMGMQGRVAISHAYALGETDDNTLFPIADALRDAGVAIMTNAPGTRAWPPIALLLDAGVTVFSGNDNVRDAWRPYGDADMLERAMLLGYRSGAMTDEALGRVFDIVTRNGACALGLSPYGLEVGTEANFVVVQAGSVAEAVVDRPSRVAAQRWPPMDATDLLKQDIDRCHPKSRRHPLPRSARHAVQVPAPAPRVGARGSTPGRGYSMPVWWNSVARASTEPGLTRLPTVPAATSG